jgi:hypothetical protein
MEEKCELLETRLRKLPLQEVLSFHAHFTECLDRAYSWSMWAAAYIIGGGCSDDSFWDFRSTVISMGREIYEDALRDPETLAKLDLEEGDDMQGRVTSMSPPKSKKSLAGESGSPDHSHTQRSRRVKSGRTAIFRGYTPCWQTNTILRGENYHGLTVGSGILREG